jgi:hypothetical protein
MPPLSLVLVRARIPEKGKHTVTHVFGTNPSNRPIVSATRLRYAPITSRFLRIK